MQQEMRKELPSAREMRDASIGEGFDEDYNLPAKVLPLAVGRERGRLIDSVMRVNELVNQLEACLASVLLRDRQKPEKDHCLKEAVRADELVTEPECDLSCELSMIRDSVESLEEKICRILRNLQL